MGYYKNEILSLLDQKNITYEMLVHSAVFTIDEVNRNELANRTTICKNLFLRNKKGDVQVLVCLPGTKKLDLKKLAQLIHCSTLSFASSKRLKDHLGVSPGSVSPFGILNDSSNTVILVLDQELLSWQKIGVHPNDNTMTLWLTPTDLLTIIKDSGNPYFIHDL